MPCRALASRHGTRSVGHGYCYGIQSDRCSTSATLIYAAAQPEEENEVSSQALYRPHMRSHVQMRSELPLCICIMDECWRQGAHRAPMN